MLRYAFHPTERFAEAVGYLFLSYMLAIPIVLFFLKGERIWRLVVIVLWLLQKPSFQIAIWLFSLLLGAFVISTQPLRALCINLSLQLRDSRSIPSKNLL